MKPGDIILIRFPQSDLRLGKLRPALIVAVAPGRHPDLLLVLITSQTNQAVPKFDDIIFKTDSDFSNTGLKVTSVVRLGRLVCVESAVINASLGRISSDRLQRIQGRLAGWLANKDGEKNKRLVRRLYEDVVNEGKVEVLDEVFIPGSMIVQSFKNTMTLMHGAFSNLGSTINYIVAENDQVAAVFGIEGVHTGPFMGQEPTGKSFYFTGIHYFRIKDGRIITARYENDLLGLLAQLGMVSSELRPDI